MALQNTYGYPSLSSTPRSAEKWKTRYNRRLQNFHTPRLSKDLQTIPFPDSFPDLKLSEGEGLFLHGDTESGKTVYVAQLGLDIDRALYFAHKNLDVLFVSVPQILEDMKRCFNDSEKNEYDVLDRVKKSGILILDDLGVSGKPSEWLLEILYSLINYRYENMLPMLITSNLDLSELSELYGDDRIISRIDRSCRIMRKTPWGE